MSLSSLKGKLADKTAKIAVIGLGYVGLPVACEFAAAGFDVIGVDILSDRVTQINAGKSPIEGNEPGLDVLLAEVTSQAIFHATTDYSELKDRDFILIDVETPVDQNNVPQYQALRKVINGIGPVIKQGVLVIVESTIAPGTMDRVVAPLMVKSSGLVLNENIFLGNCPERVMPGKLLANLRSVSRVVGGMTPETAQTMLELYKHVVKADLDPTDCVTAELVKTTENAYRDVQIAFANEVALICEAVGGDVWMVRELVNKTPYRDMHIPGAGVGGHCIPKDPWLLAHGVYGKDVPLRVIPAARAVNDSMPLHIVSLVDETLSSVGMDFTDARLLVMGYAYLEDSDDTRNSPSEILVKRLRELGSEVRIHDPYVLEYQADLYQISKGCDAVILMVRHQDYQDLDFVQLRSVLRTPIFIDGRHMFDAQLASSAGLIYHCVGIGSNLS